MDVPEAESAENNPRPLLKFLHEVSEDVVSSLFWIAVLVMWFLLYTMLEKTTLPSEQPATPTISINNQPNSAKGYIKEHKGE